MLLVGLLFFSIISILIFSRTIRNFRHYYNKKPIYGAVILCRTRIIFGLEVFGVLFLILKMIIPGPSQEEYNELLADALIKNAHATSLIYQALRKDLPASFPTGFENKTNNKLPLNIKKVPELLYDELHDYIRQTSILLSNYFGSKYPECKISNADVVLLNLDPDTELVGIELSKKSNVNKSNCGERQISTSLSNELKFKNSNLEGLEILGAIFLTQICG